MHFDAHVHSATSPDSELDPLDAINTLRSMGLGTIFTEHVDFITPVDGKNFAANDAPIHIGTPRDFVCDFEIYPSMYKSLRDPKSVLLGIEIGLNAAYYDLNYKVTNGEYDFVLGAIHYVRGIDIYNDSKYQDPTNFCRDYLTYAKEIVEYCGFFDAFAHIDYITRYEGKLNKVFEYKTYEKEFDALLSALISRDVVLEINTARFGNPNVIAQLLPIYKRYQELGGMYVTIGSDAHTKRALGRFYANAIGLAKMAKLTPVYFCDRKRFLC